MYSTKDGKRSIRKGPTFYLFNKSNHCSSRPKPLPSSLDVIVGQNEALIHSMQALFDRPIKLPLYQTPK